MPDLPSPPDVIVRLHHRIVGAAGQLPFSPGFLTEAEHAACARFLRPADAALCREARFLVRHTLAAALGTAPLDVELRRAASGKPELAAEPPPLRFNLSHSAGLALLAVSTTSDIALGIDVEAGDRTPSIDLMRGVLAPNEWQSLSALPPPARPLAFLRLWTAKEAVLKAAGLGLSAPVAQVVFNPAGTRLLALPPVLGAVADYTLCRIALPGAWQAALAVRDPRRRGVTLEMLPSL